LFFLKSLLFVFGAIFAYKMGLLFFILFVAAILCASMVQTPMGGKSMRLRRKGIRPLPTIIEETALELQISVNE
jgi:hypothetical protein